MSDSSSSIKDTPGNSGSATARSFPEDSAEATRVGRLQSLSTGRIDSDTAPRPRRYFLIAIAGCALVLLMFFLLSTIWRLHRPQFVTLRDGWYRVTDPTWGFECELPTSYSRNNGSGNRGTEYQSHFPTNWGNISIKAQQWSPSSNNATGTATGELVAMLTAEKAKGVVTSVVDNSANPQNPMIDFIVDYGSAGAPQKSRRRIFIQKKVRLDITVYLSDGVLPADVERVVNAVKWTR